jgi:cytochrome c oxidase cbb3-type subunit 1
MASAFPSDASPAKQDVSVADFEDFGVVDRALRFPLSALLGWSAFWLVLGLLLEVLASFQSTHAGFWASCPYVTFGRLYPAATNALIYGWGFNAAFAASYWILARLAGAKPVAATSSLVAIVFWNLSVLFGIGGILHGDSTGIEWLEIPGYVAPALWVSFIAIGTNIVLTLRHRAFVQTFIAQWYIIAAFFWFAWIFSISELMLVFYPVRGTVQSIISAWYVQGLFGLWFGSIALGALYYFIPKLTGRTIRYYTLAIIGFWSYGVFNGWIGVQRLAASPVPVWVQTVGYAASILALAPLAVISLNLLTTIFKGFSEIKGSAAFKFIALGAVFYTISGLQFVCSALGEKSAVAQLTFEARSQIELGFFGFFTFSVLGAIYYFLPRAAGRAWSSSGLITLHWLGSLLGLALLYIGTLFAGTTQAADFADPSLNFVQIFEHISGFLTLRTIGFAVLLLAQLVFALNVLRTFCFGAPEVSIQPSTPALEVLS